MKNYLWLKVSFYLFIIGLVMVIIPIFYFVVLTVLKLKQLFGDLVVSMIVGIIFMIIALIVRKNFV